MACLGAFTKNTADRSEVLSLNGKLRGNGTTPEGAGTTPSPSSGASRGPGVVGAGLVVPASRAALVSLKLDPGQFRAVEGASESPFVPPCDLAGHGGDEEQGHGQDDDDLHAGV